MSGIEFFESMQAFLVYKRKASSIDFAQSVRSHQGAKHFYKNVRASTLGLIYLFFISLV